MSKESRFKCDACGAYSAPGGEAGEVPAGWAQMTIQVALHPDHSSRKPGRFLHVDACSTHCACLLASSFLTDQVSVRLSTQAG